VLSRSLENLWVEYMRGQFIAGHLGGVLLSLRHGDPMSLASVDLMTLVEQYSTDERCREALTRLRWPNGVTCLRCGHKKVTPVNDRKVFDCNSCHYQFSVTVGTMLEDSHLPLTKWFLITYLMTESKKGIAASQVYRMLGKKSYKTAWYLCHRIRAAMAAAADRPKLGGTIEVDEKFIGGRQRGSQLKPGNPLCKKEVVIGIRQRGGELRFFHAADVKSGTLAKYIKENVSEDVDVIMTDGFQGYPKALHGAGVLAEHKTVCHKDGVYVDGDIYTSTVESAFSLLKRGIIGTWHRVSAKHLQAYLNEMCFRFDNRKNPYLFRDTLLRLLKAEHLEYKELTADSVAA
jgi:transposase-like protein